jgi:hypothetical protein
MNVPITLAGSMRVWRTLEGRQVSQWVGSGPWFNGPQVLSARVTAGLSSEFIDAVRTDVRGSRQWGGVVRVDELHSHGPDASFSQSLSTWMAIEATNKRVLCEALGRISNAQPRLLTVHVGPGVSAALWLEECRRILDIYNKITEIPAVAVLVVGTYAARYCLAGWRGWTVHY